jgi:hypothetical protein
MTTSNDYNRGRPGSAKIKAETSKSSKDTTTAKRSTKTVGSPKNVKPRRNTKRSV